MEGPTPPSNLIDGHFHYWDRLVVVKKKAFFNLLGECRQQILLLLRKKTGIQMCCSFMDFELLNKGEFSHFSEHERFLSGSWDNVGFLHHIARVEIMAEIFPV